MHPMPAGEPTRWRCFTLAVKSEFILQLFISQFHISLFLFCQHCVKDYFYHFLFIFSLTWVWFCCCEIRDENVLFMKTFPSRKFPIFSSSWIPSYTFRWRGSRRRWKIKFMNEKWNKMKWQRKILWSFLVIFDRPSVSLFRRHSKCESD